MKKKPRLIRCKRIIRSGTFLSFFKEVGKPLKPHDEYTYAPRRNGPVYVIHEGTEGYIVKSEYGFIRLNIEATGEISDYADGDRCFRCREW